MADKRWIKVKRGLIIDPTHRQNIGECLWLFLYMVDIAVWETGKIVTWKDGDAAKDLSMPLPTLRDQRQKLEIGGYILVDQKQHHQEITIKKWVDPREYPRYDQSEGYGGVSASGVQGDTQGNGQDHGKPSLVHPVHISESVSNPKQRKYKEPYNLNLVPVIAELCCLNLINGGRRECFDAAESLRKGVNPPTADQLRAVYGSGGKWWTITWQGKKGQVPSPYDMSKNWPLLSGAIASPATKKQSPIDSEVA